MAIEAKKVEPLGFFDPLKEFQKAAMRTKKAVFGGPERRNQAATTRASAPPSRGTTKAKEQTIRIPLNDLLRKPPIPIHRFVKKPKGSGVSKPLLVAAGAGLLVGGYVLWKRK